MIKIKTQSTLIWGRMWKQGKHSSTVGGSPNLCNEFGKLGIVLSYDQLYHFWAYQTDT